MSVDKRKWYQDGLKFKCTACGSCCSGRPGYVWVNNTERQEIAEYLGLEFESFMKKHARRVGFKYSLKEKGKKDNWNCIFLTEKDGLKTCDIYPVRPQQCRSWPFWNENLKNTSAWEASRLICPGLDCGRHHDFTNIEKQRTRKL